MVHLSPYNVGLLSRIGPLSLIACLSRMTVIDHASLARRSTAPIPNRKCNSDMYDEKIETVTNHGGSPSK